MDVVGDGQQILGYFVCYDKKYGFYIVGNGELVKSFKVGKEIIGFIFQGNYLGNYTVDGLEEVRLEVGDQLGGYYGS